MRVLECFRCNKFYQKPGKSLTFHVGQSKFGKDAVVFTNVCEFVNNYKSIDFYFYLKTTSNKNLFSI